MVGGAGAGVDRGEQRSGQAELQHGEVGAAVRTARVGQRAARGAHDEQRDVAGVVVLRVAVYGPDESVRIAELGRVSQRHGRARSSAAAIRSTAASSYGGPTIWSPVGTPDDESPLGALAAGRWQSSGSEFMAGNATAKSVLTAARERKGQTPRPIAGARGVQMATGEFGRGPCGPAVLKGMIRAPRSPASRFASANGQADHGTHPSGPEFAQAEGDRIERTGAHRVLVLHTRDE